MRALLAIVCITLSSWAHSADSWLYSDFTGERLYAEIHGGIGNIGLADLNFRPLEGQVSVGGFFLQGLGIDLNLGTALLDDDDDGFELQIENTVNLSLRFESPPKDGLSAFILVGISRFTAVQDSVNSVGQSRTVSETFQGGSLALGLLQRIPNTRFSIVGTFRTQLVDEPIDVDTYTLGVRASWF